ncbi:MAG: MFS transporter [Burkholderiales bacterium]
MSTNKPPAFAALRHAGYRPYFTTTALAMMGDNIEHVISYWVLFEKFQSPALGGIAVLTHWLPFLFFSVYTGGLADRFDSRRIIQVAQVLFLGVSVAWGVLFLTDSLQMWHAVVLLSIHGFAGVLWGPASQVLIHDIVGREHLQSAVRLNATARNLGVLLGPAVGGALMLLLGPAYGILFNAVFFLPVIFWMGRTHHGAPKADRVKPPRRGAGLGEAIAIFRQISGNPTLVSMILLAGISSLLVGNAFMAQMPEYAHDLGTEKADFSYTMLLAANAGGALMAGILLESMGYLTARPRTAIILTILWCFAIAGFALTDSYPIAVALMFVAGFLNLSFSAMAQTLVQLQAPDALRGRLIGLYNMASNGLRSFSGISVGIVGVFIGIHWSLALAALLLLAATIALLAFTTRR